MTTLVGRSSAFISVLVCLGAGHVQALEKRVEISSCQAGVALVQKLNVFLPRAGGFLAYSYTGGGVRMFSAEISGRGLLDIGREKPLRVVGVWEDKIYTVPAYFGAPSLGVSVLDLQGEVLQRFPEVSSDINSLSYISTPQSPYLFLFRDRPDKRVFVYDMRLGEQLHEVDLADFPHISFLHMAYAEEAGEVFFYHQENQGWMKWPVLKILRYNLRTSSWSDLNIAGVPLAANRSGSHLLVWDGADEVYVYDLKQRSKIILDLPEGLPAAHSYVKPELAEKLALKPGQQFPSFNLGRRLSSEQRNSLYLSDDGSKAALEVIANPYEDGGKYLVVWDLKSGSSVAYQRTTQKTVWIDRAGQLVEAELNELAKKVHVRSETSAHDVDLSKVWPNLGPLNYQLSPAHIVGISDDATKFVLYWSLSVQEISSEDLVVTLVVDRTLP